MQKIIISYKSYQTNNLQPSDKTTAVVPTTPAPTNALLVELLPSLTDAKKNGDDISSSSSFLLVALSFVDILEVEDIIDRHCINVKASVYDMHDTNTKSKHITKDSEEYIIIINLLINTMILQCLSRKQ